MQRLVENNGTIKRIGIDHRAHNRRNARSPSTTAASIVVSCVALALLVVGRPAIAGEVHEYTVTVDYLLSRLWVEARFDSPVSSITARSTNAGKYLLDVRGCEDPPQIWLRNRRMMLPEDGIECLNYAVDLTRAAKEHRGQRGLAPGNIIVSPSVWLWRPTLSASTEIVVRFRLPENIQVSVPWRDTGAAPNEYRLGRSPESANAPVVFGHFRAEAIEVPGATLRVSILKGENEIDFDAIGAWLKATATDVSLAYGRFPNPSPQVVVIPASGSRGDSAVPFGRVIRDGGESVELYVAHDQPLQSFLDDWTATHEFSHLMLPYVDSRHRWVSEGFAQYYQNVLLARAGSYDNEFAWQKLYEGFERGRQSRPEMSPNQAAAGGIRTGLMKVYWSGAALAMMADVELRKRSDGEESLDLLLDRLQNCCLPSDRVWTGPELFSRLDSFASEPVFMPLYRRYADTSGFPDVRPLLEQLGVAISNDKVRLRRHAELSDIRNEIMLTDAAVAAWRQSLAQSSGSRQSARNR